MKIAKVRKRNMDLKKNAALLSAHAICTTEECNDEMVLVLKILLGHLQALKYNKGNAGKDKEFQKKKRNPEECIIKSYEYLSDSSFVEHFRMSRTTFEAILSEVVRCDTEEIKLFHIPHSTQLLMVLWILATPDSFRSVGERFKVNKGTLHYIYVQMIKNIAFLSKKFIKWPSADEIEKGKRKIMIQTDFPGVVGCIDGTYIQIKTPIDPVRYFNRKKYAALNLQAVCNQDLYFTDIYFGEVGSLHDSRIYSRSPLSRNILEKPVELLGRNGYLLGDSAYTLSKYVMTPFRDNGHLLDEEIHYNFIHAKIRCVIERAFSLLKGKWRRLKYIDSTQFPYIVKHVMACCVLHNFILCQKHSGDELQFEENSSVNSEVVLEDTCLDDSDNEAQTIRNIIAATLYNKHFCE